MVRGSLKEFITWIRGLLRKGVHFARQNHQVLLAIAAIILGLILGLLSVVPDIEPRGTAMRSGTLPPFSELNESFTAATGLSEISLKSNSCAVFVTALTEGEFAKFLANGTRPEPQLDCETRDVTLQGSLRWVVIENRGPSQETFELSTTFYSVRYSRALLALPALPLMLASTLFLVMRTLRREIGRLTDETRER